MKIGMWIGIVGVGACVSGLLGFGTGSPTAQQQDSRLKGWRGSQPTHIKLSVQEVLRGDVVIEGDIMLSQILATADATHGSVRVLAYSLKIRRMSDSKKLGSVWQIDSVSADGGEVREFSAQVNPALGLPGSPQAKYLWECELRPRGQLTWGQVASSGDIAVSVATRDVTQP